MSGFEFLCPSTLYCCHYNYVRKLKRCMCVRACFSKYKHYIYIYLTVQTLWHTLIFVECWMVWVKWCGTWTAAGLLFVIWPKDWTSQISGWNQTHQALNDHPQSIPTFPTVVLDGIGYAPISGNGRMGWYEMSPKSGMVYDLVYRFTTVWYFNVASIKTTFDELGVTALAKSVVLLVPSGPVVHDDSRKILGGPG